MGQAANRTAFGQPGDQPAGDSGGGLGIEPVGKPDVNLTVTWVARRQRVGGEQADDCTFVTADEVRATDKRGDLILGQQIRTVGSEVERWTFEQVQDGVVVTCRVRANGQSADVELWGVDVEQRGPPFRVVGAAGLRRIGRQRNR